VPGIPRLTSRPVLFLAITLVVLAIVGFVLAQVGGGHGVVRLF